MLKHHARDYKHRTCDTSRAPSLGFTNREAQGLRTEHPTQTLPPALGRAKQALKTSTQ